MAKPVSEEELQLKKRARRRLIGAIALVAAVAAILPMVLDSEPKPTSQEINIQIPSPEAKGGFASKAVPPARPGKTVPAQSDAKVSESPVASREAADKPAATPPDNPNDAALSPSPRAAREKTVVAEKPAAKAPEKIAEKMSEKVAQKVPEKVTEKAAAPKAVPGAFFIQVIALSEADKAKQVQQQVVASGVRAYTEVITAGAGKVTRVRAGPFATREEADKALVKLQGIGLEGKVTAY